jgi:hypothetical protein
MSPILFNLYLDESKTLTKLLLADDQVIISGNEEIRQRALHELNKTRL